MRGVFNYNTIVQFSIAEYSKYSICEDVRLKQRVVQMEAPHHSIPKLPTSGACSPGPRTGRSAPCRPKTPGGRPKCGLGETQLLQLASDVSLMKASYG